MIDSKTLSAALDAMAPDGSEIRLLTATGGGSMAHCTLPPGRTSQAVRHRTVEEVWYFLEGEGEVWRSAGGREENTAGGREEITAVGPGLSLNIPLGTHFQFRNPGPGPLCFIIVTMPPWPGDGEAERVEGHWPPD